MVEGVFHILLPSLLLFSFSAKAISLQHVTVHDPSVVWDPESKTYYIFGSHRDNAKTTDMMRWTKVAVPWATASSNNAANKDAFTTPQVTTVKKGGIDVNLPKFNAVNWSAKGGSGYNVDGNMWAPDVIFNKAMNKWCMYLSINGDSWYSSIILLTADKISGPYRYQAPVVISGFKNGTEFKDTDLELVIGSQSSLPSRYATGSKWGDRWPNNIDPCVFYDEEGKLWMSYGSWSGGIWMLELDENTGLRDYDVAYTLTGTGNGITEDPYFGKKIAGGYYVSGEASYIEYIGGYYFLFMSYGGLAAGGVANDYNNGGYQMRVFRSEKPDGPYKDSNNISAVYNSYQLNFGANAQSDRGVNIFGAYTDWGNQTKGNYGERSQGHNSIIAAEDGRTYLVYHTRFQNAGEGHQVRVHQVFQNKDGWLVAAPFEYTGEEITSADVASSQQVSTDRIPGTYQLLIHKYRLDHTKKEAAKPVEITLSADGKISGGATGTWAATAGTSYVNFVISGTAYRGVMVEQTLEPKDEKTIAFTGLASKTGVTAWAYQTKAATGIEDVRWKMDDGRSKMEEGRGVYDLLGRPVTSLQKPGIYIKNGKKFIVK
jgi:arabinan endo-1,5-alpha-L-arabinosidase